MSLNAPNAHQMFLREGLKDLILWAITPLLFEIHHLNLKSPWFHGQKAALSILGLKCRLQGIQEQENFCFIFLNISASTPPQVLHNNFFEIVSSKPSQMSVFEYNT
jgi:hypothetical protein